MLACSMGGCVAAVSAQSPTFSWRKKELISAHVHNEKASQCAFSAFFQTVLITKNAYLVLHVSYVELLPDSELIDRLLNK